MLEDGAYEVFVVDAEALDDREDAMRLELAVTCGPHKGDVLAVVATQLHSDPISVLGLPATLIVERGQPRVELS